MTPAQFRAWLALMRANRGWLKADCARHLGASPSSMYNWSHRGAPRYIGLAISALMVNLPPWPIRPEGEAP